MHRRGWNNVSGFSRPPSKYVSIFSQCISRLRDT
jgi:hypothetical protein